MLQLDGFPTGDSVKADRSAGRLTGSMMELQTLQEALKVEIQIHQKLVAQMKQDPQNADLKKQLHELQAKITALSEKQKKVVEQLRKELLVKQEPETKLQLQVQTPSAGGDIKPAGLLPSQQIPGGLQQTLTVTPVLTAKTLPLVLKAAATPPLPGSVLPPRPATVAMVTTAITKPDSQNAPINLQVASKLSGQSVEPVRLVSKNAMVVQATTASTAPAQPIKVPQFVPPPRLTPRPTYQPQVRPKPATPTNVPIAPAPPPPMMAAPQLLQRPVMLATKLSSSLPSAAPIHQVRIVNGQPCSKTTTTPLTGIVIATSVSAPPARLASPAQAPNPSSTPVPTLTPTQPIQISSLTSDPKQTVKLGGAELKVAVSLPSSSTPPLSPPPRPKKEENPEKLAFMVSLGLVTHDHLEEIQSKRQERKRRTTANPVYSGAVFEPERKKSAVSYLNSPLHQGTRKRGRPPKHSSVPELGSLTPTSPSSPVHPLPMPSPSSGDGDIHEDFCTVCRRSGQLLMCDTCSRVYHLDCLDPPLKTIPKGMWICPKCQDQILKKEEAIPWPGTLAIVHSYIAYKEAKEEEKQKLMKWSSELKVEREQLEQRVKQLSNSITKCMETKNSILSRQKEMQLSLDKVQHLIRLIQAFSLGPAPPEGARTKEAAPPAPPPSDAARTKEAAPTPPEGARTKEAAPPPPSDAARTKEAAPPAPPPSDAARTKEAAPPSPSDATRTKEAAPPAPPPSDAARTKEAAPPPLPEGPRTKEAAHPAPPHSEGARTKEAAPPAPPPPEGARTKEAYPPPPPPSDAARTKEAAPPPPSYTARTKEAAPPPLLATDPEAGGGSPVKPEAACTSCDQQGAAGTDQTAGRDPGAAGGGGSGAAGTGLPAEGGATPETETGVAGGDAPSASPGVAATTNGTTEPSRPELSPASNATAPASESPAGGTDPPNMEKKQEEINDDGDNNKTSEPSKQRGAELSSSDGEK